MVCAARINTVKAGMADKIVAIYRNDFFVYHSKFLVRYSVFIFSFFTCPSAGNVTVRELFPKRRFGKNVVPSTSSSGEKESIKQNRVLLNT
ncbi:MAG: hypothetical protein COZ80_13075 [Ignavibacteria bacterium CG_4_8_14_3_um_filter_37_9]|nr:MAG: hypothetical protein AUJ54_09535 [Ignavibacteria bacterium CG1_02_37_35]PIS44507.1 MAG: hypothetical protein COT22_10225 [Ignavibacteria bacterium CG08_land_8_20_14_0_20_37_9]PIW97973.1 MAG: hypothetical protein COZ80_13075 [Ignavibacteria bacterium CG_4_8_14_3_um_filter_37_9]PIX94394.1 MAG: hypothetical protein COZ25_05785 [Ignavibacteria bacterium CG_4_10_14_3_um_filter_37_18]PJC57309.1 MAG: hypothetical protein CO025_13990 [Ignavibacteria bacterium CG_4_9_14_0_2_um_filter_37_13]